MRKKLLTAVIATSLIISSAPFTEAVYAVDSGQIIKSVNFRDQPSVSSNQIRYLQTGEQVEIIERINSYWYKVKDQTGRIGYISTKNEYIKVLSQTNSSSSSETNAEIVRGVSFRTGPSTSDTRIRYLQQGEQVFILSQPNSYWYQVRDQQGQTGYVSSNSKYISTAVSTETTPEVSDSSASGNGKILWGVSFRTGPSTSDSRIRYMQKGEIVTVLSQPNSYWYQVRDQSGQVGYISSSSKYISTDYMDSANSGGSDTANLNASELAQKVISAGMKYLGTPYEFGSSRFNTSTFDCSDFVRQAFLDGAGIRLPADSRQQGDYVKNIGKTSTNWRDLQPGDIMFFMSYEGTSQGSYSGINKSTQRITHNAIYLGDGKILHTYSKKSGGVKIDDISGRHWEYRFLFGGRAI
jgi:cell wall-associated NlpC family hydrolase